MCKIGSGVTGRGLSQGTNLAEYLHLVKLRMSTRVVCGEQREVSLIAQRTTANDTAIRSGAKPKKICVHFTAAASVGRKTQMALKRSQAWASEAFFPGVGLTADFSR